jgi:hypothetical protein
MKIINKKAVQAHPVPDRVTAPYGPFSAELLAEPEIIYDYDQAYGEDGSDFAQGATVQNNFKPLKYLRCSVCLVRVLETETESHKCED